MVKTYYFLEMELPGRGMYKRNQSSFIDEPAQGCNVTHVSDTFFQVCKYCNLHKKNYAFLKKYNNVLIDPKMKI